MVHRAIFSYLRKFAPLLLVLFLTIGVGVAANLTQRAQDNRQKACDWITTSCGSGCADYFATRPECTREGGGTPATSEPVPGSPGEGCDNGVSVGGTACRNQGEPRHFKCQPGSRPGASIWQEEVCSGNGTCQGTTCTTTAQTTGTGTVVAPATCDSSGDTAYSCRGKTVGHDNGGCTCQITSGTVCGCIAVTLDLPTGAGCVANENCQSRVCAQGRCQGAVVTPTSTPTANPIVVVNPTPTPRPNGALCSNNNQCQSGFCDPNTDQCSAGLSTPSSTPNANPTPRPNGFACSRDAQCNSGYCKSETSRCETRLAANGALCSTDAQCQSGICDENIDRCVATQPVAAISTPNANPTPRPNGFACSRDTQCNSGYCKPETNKCETRPAANGALCSTDAQCQSGICDENIDRCVATQPVAAISTPNTNPTPRPNGFACSRDTQCSSGYCNRSTSRCELPASPTTTACGDEMNDFCNQNNRGGCQRLTQGNNQVERCINPADHPTPDDISICGRDAQPACRMTDTACDSDCIATADRGCVCSVPETQSTVCSSIQSSACRVAGFVECEKTGSYIWNYRCSVRNNTLAGSPTSTPTVAGDLNCGGNNQIPCANENACDSGCSLESGTHPYCRCSEGSAEARVRLPDGECSLYVQTASSGCSSSFVHTDSSCSSGYRCGRAPTPPPTALLTYVRLSDNICTYNERSPSSQCESHTATLDVTCASGYKCTASRGQTINQNVTPSSTPRIMIQSCGGNYQRVCQNSPPCNTGCSNMGGNYCRCVNETAIVRQPDGECSYYVEVAGGPEISETCSSGEYYPDLSCYSRIRCGPRPQWTPSCQYRGLNIPVNQPQCYAGEPRLVLSCSSGGGQIGLSYCDSGMVCNNGECETVENPDQYPTCYYGSSSCSALGRISANGCRSCSGSYQACCGEQISTLNPAAFVCRANEFACKDLNTLRRCSSDGTAWVEARCREGKVCSDGSCIDPPTPDLSCNCIYLTGSDLENEVFVPILSKTIAMGRCQACMPRVNGHCGWIDSDGCSENEGQTVPVETTVATTELDALRTLYPNNYFYYDGSSDDNAIVLRSVAEGLELLPPELMTHGNTYVIGDYGDSGGGGNYGMRDIITIGNPDCNEAYYQNKNLVCGYGMSIVVHETLHDFGEVGSCINGNCQTFLEHFVEASAQDGVFFTSEAEPQSVVTQGADFLLYSQYATSDIEGFAISGAAYVLAADDLRRNQPEVYEFYRDYVFEGREYIEILNDDCRSSRVEVKTTETIQLQQQVQRQCAAGGM